MDKEARIRRHAAAVLGPVGTSLLPRVDSAVPPKGLAQKPASGARTGEGSKCPKSKAGLRHATGASADREVVHSPIATSAKFKRRVGGALRQGLPTTAAGASLGRNKGQREDVGHDRLPGDVLPAQAEKRGEKRRKRLKKEPKAKRLQGSEGTAISGLNGGAAPANSSAAGARLRQEGQLQGVQEASRSPSVLGRMRAHLAGGRFRMLNEAMYTRSGDEALRLFGAEPGAFASYHAGFREQVARWPQNPLDCVIQWLGDNDPGGELVVADFGCGEAQLAASVRQKVFSLDLVAWTPQVTACNMAHTPLESESVDVGVFCLSLMGTDYPSFILEADRTLRPQGHIVIAEVRSRFEDKADAGESLFDAFEQCMKRIGYKLTETVHTNKMFLVCIFQKRKTSATPSKDLHWPILKPCMYKRR